MNRNTAFAVLFAVTFAIFASPAAFCGVEALTLTDGVPEGLTSSSTDSGQVSMAGAVTVTITPVPENMPINVLPGISGIVFGAWHFDVEGGPASFSDLSTNYEITTSVEEWPSSTISNVTLYTVDVGTLTSPGDLTLAGMINYNDKFTLAPGQYAILAVGDLAGNWLITGDQIRVAIYTGDMLVTTVGGDAVPVYPVTENVWSQTRTVHTGALDIIQASSTVEVEAGDTRYIDFPVSLASDVSGESVNISTIKTEVYTRVGVGGSPDEVLKPKWLDANKEEIASDTNPSFDVIEEGGNDDVRHHFIGQPILITVGETMDGFFRFQLAPTVSPGDGFMFLITDVVCRGFVTDEAIEETYSPRTGFYVEVVEPTTPHLVMSEYIDFPVSQEGGICNIPVYVDSTIGVAGGEVVFTFPPLGGYNLDWLWPEEGEEQAFTGMVNNTRPGELAVVFFDSTSAQTASGLLGRVKVGLPPNGEGTLIIERESALYVNPQEPPYNGYGQTVIDYHVPFGIQIIPDSIWVPDTAELVITGGTMQGNVRSSYLDLEGNILSANRDNWPQGDRIVEAWINVSSQDWERARATLVMCSVMADVFVDGTISWADFFMAAIGWLDWQYLSPYQFTVADIDGNGEIAFLDVWMILQKVSPDEGSARAVTNDPDMQAEGQMVYELVKQTNPELAEALQQNVETSFGIILAVEEDDTIPTPDDFQLNQNYPNPFNPQTTVSFELSQAGETTLTIYSASGQKVIELVSEYREAGRYEVVWDGRDSKHREVGAGVYTYAVGCGTWSAVRRMTLIK